MDRYDVIVFLGRFQPPTNRQLALLQSALDRAAAVIVLIGSAAQPRSIIGPWKFPERRTMLLAALEAQVTVLPLPDILYDDLRWAARVREALASALVAQELTLATARIGFCACERRGAEYYAGLFPDWSWVNDQTLPEPAPALLEPLLEAADDMLPDAVASQLPPVLVTLITHDLATADFQALKREYAHIRSYRTAWQEAPFPPIFVTLDAVVTHRDALLLIRRGRMPGMGLWALPGGFLDPRERLLAGALRELAEETAIALDAESLACCLRHSEIFDEPYRSLRGRTITHAFWFDLPADAPRPAVTGGDDAAQARWIPLVSVTAPEMFEDHYAILQRMLGID